MSAAYQVPNCAKCCQWCFIASPQHPYHIDMLSFLSGKLKCGEKCREKPLAQGHPASKWQSQYVFEPRFPASEPILMAD